MKTLSSHSLHPTIVLLLLLATSVTSCAIVRAPAPTAPSEFTLRPTPGGGTNTIDMTATDFVRHSLTVKRGSEVTFVVRLNSGPHIICLGKNGTCEPSLPGPPELRQDGGFSLDAGQSLTLDFSSPGVYPITCSIYPSMNVTIAVT